MRYPETIVPLRDGSRLTLRSAGPQDAEAVLAYLEATTAETPYLLREPGESSFTPEQERQFLQSRADSPRDLMLLGFYEGELVGSCALASLGPFRRVAHRCDVSIALYRKFCGKGMGTAMMTALLAQAKAAGYEQAELTVMADNKPAIALYERLGFVSCGTLPHNMKYADGSYADACWMAKSL